MHADATIRADTERVIFRDERTPPQRHHRTIHLTRQDARGIGRAGSRLRRWLPRSPVARHPRSHVCGPTAFVETVATGLVGLLGVVSDEVRSVIVYCKVDAEHLAAATLTLT